MFLPMSCTSPLTVAMTRVAAARRLAGGAEERSSNGKIVMATVKGDVHDIGKNIVGVVLGCNSYDVIDLGVMVPQDRILQTAIDSKADMVGLSGLITPSLDEMVSVAKEMQRRRMTIPLLIGGATTSRQHTAVKIAQEYDQPVVHVLDASRAVDVVSRLLSPAAKGVFDIANRDEQARLREQHAQRTRKPLLPLPAARANRVQIDWAGEELPVPEFLGSRRIEQLPLSTLVPFIDWTFFFHAWELKGRVPAIFDHPQYGSAARELYDNARVLLERIVRDGSLTASGVYGFWPANSDVDDIVVFADEERTDERLRFNMLRQQEQIADDKPNRSLADFVAPASSGRRDYVGAFAVTAGLGAGALVSSFERDHDDYQAIMVKALADRLAEAFAEHLHAQVRREWGYGRDEALSVEELQAEKFRGIRPAFGYPACPDHTEKRKLFDLLEASSTGISLTESYAMSPAASVSGLYLAHPRARYFMVGRIGADQVEDYARRKGLSVEEVERWLAPNLAYDAQLIAAGRC